MQQVSLLSLHYDWRRLRETGKRTNLNVIDIVTRIVVVGNIDIVDIIIVVIVVVVIIVVVAVGIADEVGRHRGSGQHEVDEGEARDGTCCSTVWFSIITFYIKML